MSFARPFMAAAWLAVAAAVLAHYAGQTSPITRLPSSYPGPLHILTQER